MRSLLTMVVMLAALLPPSCSPAFAQPRQQAPANEGPNCLPVHELKADAQVVRLMQDSDGDWWAMVRFTSTGRTLIGFVSRANGKFCVSAEGKTSPES